MSNRTNLEPFLATALLATEHRETQVQLLKEVSDLKKLPDGHQRWLNSWVQPDSQLKIDLAKRSQGGLDLGHPVTWPKDTLTECQVSVGPRPNDPVYYVYGLLMRISTSEDPGFYFGTIPVYYVVWYTPWNVEASHQPDESEPAKVTSADWQAFDRVLTHLVTVTDGKKRGEELHRKAFALQQAIARHSRRQRPSQ